MNQSTAGERITAAVSTVVAIVLLGAAVTADPAPGLPADRIQSLESDLRFQLELAFRADGPDLLRRGDQVDAALAAWRASARGAREEQALVAWLQEALTESMPGRGGAFPEIPDFSPPPAPADLAPSRSMGRADGAQSPTATPAGPEPAPHRRTTPAAPRPVQLPPATAVDSGPPRAPRTVQRPIIVSVSPPEPIVDGMPELPLSASTAGPAADAPSAEPSVTAPTSSPSSGTPAPQPLPPAPAESDVPYTWAVVPRTPIEPAGESERPANEEAAPWGTILPEATPAIRVNLRELNARIHGYHQTLGEVEAATVVAGLLSERELERLVAQLESLAGQYQLVQLYYDALSDAERRQVATPRAMRDVIDLVNRHVQAADESNDIFAEFDAADAAPASGSPLAERLRKVAEAAGQSDD